MRRFEKYKKLTDVERQRYFHPLREPVSSGLDSSDARYLSLREYIFDNLRYIVKDLKDTFKPYKNIRQVFRDLISFSLGVLNISSALMSLMSMTFIFIFAVPLLFFKAYNEETQREANKMKIKFFDFYASQITLLIKGIFQVVLTPLNFCRMPLRIFLGWLKGHPRIEDNKGIKKLVAECYKPGATEETIFLAEKALHDKVIKANKWYQLTRIGPLYNITSRASVFSYRFFQAPPELPYQAEDVFVYNPPGPGL